MALSLCFCANFGMAILFVMTFLHIDSLMERLKEAQVQKIVEPLLIDDSQRYDLLDDDYQFV